MTKSAQKACIWSGAAMVALFTASVLLAGLFPPPSPTQTATTVAHTYLEHATRIRIGLVIGTFAAAFMGPFTAAITQEVKKMSRSSTAASLQLIFGTMFLASLFFPMFLFMAAAFRPGRPAAVTQGLNDAAFIAFVAPVSVSVFELVLLGYAMLGDVQATRTFPRWFAEYTIATGVVFGCGGFCVLTKTGPFAWNGLLSYYLPFAMWGSWVVGMIYYLIASVNRATEDRDFATPPDSSALAERITVLEAAVACMRHEPDQIGVSFTQPSAL